MLDVATKGPVRVQNYGTAGPFIDLSVDQLDAVVRLLTARGVRHWVEEDSISIDDGPDIATINFGRDGDSDAIQAIIDAG